MFYVAVDAGDPTTSDEVGLIDDDICWRTREAIKGATKYATSRLGLMDDGDAEQVVATKQNGRRRRPTCQIRCC